MTRTISQLDAAAMRESANWQRIHDYLIGTNTLMHRRRCYEASRLVTLDDVRELFAQQPLVAWVVAADDVMCGFAALSVRGEGATRMAHLHCFMAQTEAAQLLDTVLQWCEAQELGSIRQSRCDPISSVFRIEADTALLALFAARGFNAGEVAGNMELDLRHFRWTDTLQARSDALHAQQIVIRRAHATDLPTLSALNAAEGLALWDAHLHATAAADAFERLHVAAQAGQIIGYANFFAARWQSELPEFGPLLVAKAYRKAGLGHVLTAQALLFAQAQGKQRVRLSTLRPTFYFYRQLGFEVTASWQEHLWKSLQTENWNTM